MKRYRPTIRDRLFQHHTENDVLKIILVQGKKHNHLEIMEGYLDREFIGKRNELIDFAIKLLREYKSQKRGKTK